MLKYTMDDSYERIEINNDKSYIFNVKNIILFLPKCQKINEIILIKSNECYKDIKIKIQGYDKISNRKKNNSRQRNCSKIIIRNLNNKFIIEKNNSIIIKNREESIDLDIVIKNISFNFPHYEELTEQHELVQLYGELIDNKNNNNNIIFIERINSTIDIKYVKVVNIMKKLVNTLIYTIIITTLL
jgi:hypothetical protein